MNKKVKTARLSIFSNIKFLNKEEIGFLFPGFFVMLFSGIINFFVSHRLYKAADETDSIELEADAIHLKTDVYTFLGIAAGILIIWITGLHFLDPFIAIAVALLILHESFSLIKKSYTPLLDKKLPDEDIKKIELILNKFTGKCFQYHQLRTRKSGSQKYLDFHFEVPDKLNVREAMIFATTLKKN